MELLISMKAETLNKGIYFQESNIMQMPTAQSKGYFIAEFREGNEEKLRLLKKYGEILRQKLEGDDVFLVEDTNIGFKLLKRVEDDKEYMEAWEDWVVFSRNLLKELEDIVDQ
ncbi:MAG TPA: hypothetical protein VHC46_05485 [Thermodesulfobacteriota bacterium]|nr:hypothetical protein [Thermodesulfobacteriota bacterium]